MDDKDGKEEIFADNSYVVMLENLLFPLRKTAASSPILIELFQKFIN